MEGLILEQYFHSVASNFGHLSVSLSKALSYVRKNNRKKKSMISQSEYHQRMALFKTLKNKK